MLSDAVIIGLVILLLCSAMCFYMYVRIMFLEKKVTVMESILVDVRVALDSVMMEPVNQPPLPLTHTPGTVISSPAPLDPSESEVIPEENFYSSVLEQAHDKDAEVAGEESVEKVLESFGDLSGTPTAVALEAEAIGPNFDAMTRKELIAIAEKRGLRVKGSMNRGDVLSLLRRSSPTQNDLVPTGAENVSGSTGNTLQPAASFDGSAPVDFGNSGANLEAAI
jgi:hypothetical protein